MGTNYVLEGTVAWKLRNILNIFHQHWDIEAFYAQMFSPTKGRPNGV